MISTILAQLGLASAGILFVLVAATIVRWTIRRDTVVRYRIDVVLLAAAIGLLPAQLLIVELLGTDPAVESVPTADVAVNAFAAESDTASPPGNHGSIGAASAGATGPDRVSAVSVPVDAAVSPQFVRSIMLFSYFAGCAVLLALAVVRVLRTLTLLGNCRQVTDHSILQIAHDTSGFDHVMTRILMSDRLGGPASVALFGRYIILPADADRYDREHLRCVFEHELVHLNRRDSLICWAERALLCAFWFHPAAWVFCRMLDDDRELSCDAMIIRATGKKHTYARSLLACCSISRKSDSPLLLATRFGSAATLNRRIRMLNHADERISRQFVFATWVGVLAMIFVLGMGQSQLALAAGINSLGRWSDEETRLTMNVKSSPDRRRAMTAVVQAPKHGRSDAEIFDHLQQGFQLRGISMGGWVTNQETAVSAQEAIVNENSIRAREILINLPEGSKLTARLSGKSLTIAPGSEDTEILLKSGRMEVMDENGVTRFIGESTDQAGTLRILASIAGDEVVFRLTSDGDVQVRMDLQTGIPQDEDQPPHGAIRWDLQQPDSGDASPVRVKMQWIYDMQQLQKDAEDERDAD